MWTIELCALARKKNGAFASAVFNLSKAGFVTRPL